MSNKNIELIDKKIKEIAKDYREKGYKVILEPKGLDIPYFLSGFEPDIIAINDNENVVVEVKTESTINKAPYLEKIAQAVDKQSDWRFELVITNSKNQSTINTSDQNELNLNQLKLIFEEVKTLLDLNHLRAAFIISWSGLESIARTVLEQENIQKSGQLNVLISIKNLFSYGLINKDDYDFLYNTFQKRNKVVHGFQTSELSKEDVLRLLKLSSNLLNQNY